MIIFFDETIPLINASSTTWILASGYHLLNDDPDEWDTFDQRYLALAMTDKWSSDFYNYAFLRDWLMPKIGPSTPARFFDSVGKRLERVLNLSRTDWLAGILHCYQVNQLTTVPIEVGPAKLADYVASQDELQLQEVATRLGHFSHILLLLLLHKKKENVVDRLAPVFLQHLASREGLTINTACAEVLLKLDANRYEPLIVRQMAMMTHPAHYLYIQNLLLNQLPQKYQSQTLKLAYDYLECVRRQAKKPGAYLMFPGRFDEKERRHVSDLEKPVALILNEGRAEGIGFVEHWLTDLPKIPTGLLYVFAEHALQIGPAFFMQGLQKRDDTGDFLKTFFKLLPTIHYEDYYSQIWAFTRDKSKQLREMAAVTLAKLGEVAIPEAEKLLNDKKADARQTGALILSLIKTERALALLRDALDNERNDDARDLMLDSLAGLLPVPTTPDEVGELVAGARKRGKLETPVFSYLLENKLPDLFWKTTGQPLDAETIRFLFYRQSRSKDIRPDVEVRPLYDLIDRDQSHAFAGAVLKAYFDSGADAKGKACLTIGGMLGGEAETDILKTKVNQWAEGSRGKMAEYAVQALALIGSNRALRAVEFFSRKYKSKNKNIGAAASEAFTIAAETLGISPYDLADSIIPDFGFKGLFREFEAGGETYRAFVDTQFKLAFLNEDNELIKSVPKATAATLKDEFKEIGKEIRDIVKAQSGRLEQYLVIQRKWPVDRWQAFFLGNAVMFSYAVRLIWGVFDAGQNLLFPFQCQEDQTLINADGDEIDLGELAESEDFIGMVHPLSLTAGQINYWTEQLADAGIEPIFPQLNRRVVTLPATDQNLTIDRQFEGVEYGGYGFVSKMDKLGWRRGSIQDGGWIASFYKDFSELGITAIVLQQGNISMGYYDENAALGNLMFVRNGSVRFGSYSYDDPDKDTDPRLIEFGQVPPIVYAEVMADLEFFRENDLRKNHDN